MLYRKNFMVLVLFLIPQLSFAGGTTCMTVNSGNWSDTNTWNCGGNPLPADQSYVTIKPGHTVALDIDSPNISNLTIEPTGDLNVAASVNGLSLNISTNSGATALDLTEASIELFGDFTINAHQLDIKLGNVIGKFALTLNSEAETRFMGTIGGGAQNLTALTTDALGGTVFDIPNGGINSPNFIVYGPRTFNDEVRLVQPTHIKGNPGPIIFNGKINSDSSSLKGLFFSYLINSTLQFNQNVGDINNLSDLEIFNSSGATIELNHEQLSVKGRIALSGNVVLNSPTENVLIENTSTSINSLVGLGSNSNAIIRTAQGVNPNSLTIDSPNNKVLVLAPVGDNSQPLADFTINATNNVITLNTPSITTTGIQSYTGDITMGQVMSLKASQIKIDNNIYNADFDLSIYISDTLNSSYIAGVLSGMGDLIKTGLGDLGFTSQASTKGNILLTEGSVSNNSTVKNLFVDAAIISLETNTVANLGTGTFKNIDLSNGQIIMGSGLINGVLNVLGGTVAPGLSSGQVTNTLRINSIVMNNQSTLMLQLNGSIAGDSYDQIIVNGANVSNGILNLSLGFTPAIGDTFKIISATDSVPLVGTFNGLLEGDTLMINNSIFSISYNGGDGNDVVLTVTGATRYYVDVDAIGGDGTSWNSAFNTLQDAFAVATVGEIWVADGVYYPDEGGSQIDNDRSASFTLIDGVSLYGGFNGTEILLNQRDSDANVTILSGDIDKNDTNDDINFIAESPDQVVGNNSYNILVGRYTNIPTIFDGFTVTAGRADSVSNTSKAYGAGMYCDFDVGNPRGPKINQVHFIGNFAQKVGSATYGCSNNVTNSSFVNNESLDVGGSVFATGGYYENVRFEGNSSDSTGGAIRNLGNPMTIKNSSFIGNSTQSGNGGALHSTQGVLLENVLFRGNKAVDEGGALYISSFGGTPPNATLINVTLTGNLAGGLGGAISLDNSATLDLQNCIIWNNKDNSAANLTTSINVNSGSSMAQNNSLAQYFGTSGIGNLDQDPMFILDADPSIAPTSIGNAHLNINSPAIAQGDDTFVTQSTDLDGNTRIVNTVEMGAYEFASATLSVDVSGLLGSLVLQNNGADDLSISNNSIYTFSQEVARYGEYNLVIFSQATTPNQTCIISNPTGTVVIDLISDVICSTNSYFIGGNVSGLILGNTIQLQNNSTDDLTISNNDAFIFNTPVLDGQNYTVTIVTQPNNPIQPCSLTNGIDTVAGDDVTTVDVTCEAGTDLIFSNNFEL